MASVLDMILVEELINTPTTVSSNFTTDATDITYKEDAFAIQMNYSGGVSVNMDVSLEVSLDGVNYATIPESIQTITDATGSIIYDLLDSGSHFMRLAITVTTGSIDVNLVVIQMRRRH